MASVSYQVRIFDRSNTFLTSLNDPPDLSWSKAINKAGSATFGIDNYDAKATTTNLRPFNRVEVWRRSYPYGTYQIRATLVWRGYIEVISGKMDKLSVVCQETLNLFQYRITAASKTFAGTDGGQAAFTLLSDTNAVQNSFVTAGTENITATINTEFKRESVLSAWGKIAEAVGGAEYEIRASYAGAVLTEALNFKTSLGTDKSSTVIFRYIAGRADEVNLVDYEGFVDGKAMTNDVYAASSAGGTAEQNATDATSKTTYGLLQHFAQMNEKTANASLLAGATDILTQNKNPLQIPKITPDASKIDIESFGVGDTIRLILKRGYIDIDASHRILAMSVRIGNNSDEQVDIQLATVGQRTIRMNVLAGLDDLKNRVGKIERSN